MSGGGSRRRLSRLRRRPPAATLDELQTWKLEQPLAGIHGWGLAERGLDRVEVSIDGERNTRARLFCIPRPDVGWPLASAPIAGWEAPVDLIGFEPGRSVAVTATAYAGAGAAPLGTRSMVIEPAPPMPREDPEWLETLRARASADAAPAPPAPPLRVLAVTHQLDLGGAQLYLHELLRLLLADRSIECTVLAQSDGVLREELERWGVQVHVIGQEPRVGSVYESRMRELIGLANGFRPNVALVNTTRTFPGVDLADRLGIPSLWTIHESVPVEHYPRMAWPPFDDHVRSRFIASLGLADRLVFEAEATRELYLAYAAPGATRKVDYGIDLDQVARERASLDPERLRAERGFGPRDRIVTCLGTIEPRKSQASLALAFARLAGEFPDARLVLVGDRDGDYSRALREAIGRMGGVGERVRVVDLTAETASWYAVSDCFALPSDLESLPRSILEAMAFGLPVLAADAFGVADVVGESNGVLCEPRSLGSLTAALRRVLEADRAELEGLGDGGRRTVTAAHDSRGYATALRAELERLVAGAGERLEPSTGPA